MANGIVAQRVLVSEQRGELLTTSVIIAEQLEARHGDLISVIDKYLGFDYAVQRSEILVIKGKIQHFYPATYKNNRGKEYPMWLLNEPAFIKTMTLTQRYRKADEVVNDIIFQFERMRRLLQQRQNAEWIEARNAGKRLRKQETDGIKAFVEYAKAQGSQNAERYYANISTMENKALFLVEQKYPNLRDVLDVTQLGLISVADTIVLNALAEGIEKAMHYKDIYKLAKERVEALGAAHGRVLVPSDARKSLPTS